jgi:hypothetical protein
LFVQDFAPGQDTLSTRRLFGEFDKEDPPESFAMSPAGDQLIYANSEIIESLMLAEGVRGIAPARPVP